MLECSISHRLGAYLQGIFPDWDVDCEYNRDGVGPKKIDHLALNSDVDDTETRTVFPDIVAHRRGTKTNHLAIEIKESSSTVEYLIFHVGITNKLLSIKGMCLGMKIKLIAGIIALSALTGCTQAQAPTASSSEYTTQHKMQAVYHWDVLAEEVVAKLVKKSLTGRTIDIVSVDNTDFEMAFEDLLITRMVDAGIGVRKNDRKNDSNSLELEFDIQLVNHQGRGQAPKTEVTNLVNATYTNTEAVINVSVMDGDYYVMRKTGIYYINTPDYEQYLGASTPNVVTKRLSVVSE